MDLPGRTRAVTRLQERHRVAQVRDPFRAALMCHAGRRRAQRQPLSEQGLGDISPVQHKMQVAQRRA